MEKQEKTCKYFKKCGGCQLWNMNYEEQLHRKQGHMIALLGEFGHVEDIIGMDEPLRYRAKVCAAFGLDARHNIVSGIYQPGSHAIVPVDDCLIEDETADRIIVDIRHMLRSFKIQVFDERNGSGWLRHVLVRRGFQTGQVLVVLVAVSPIFKLQKPFVKVLLEKHPEITSIVLNVNDRFGPVVLGTKEKVLYGGGTVEDVICGSRFRISPRSFCQVNPVQTEVLYDKAMEFARIRESDTALDAYCGIGTIGLIASRYAKQVIGVEINQDAVKDAIVNAKLNGIKNCWFTAGDAGKYMEQMAADRVTPDVVFMDPPRQGADMRFLDSLVNAAPKRVVYISCGPDSLKRDLQVLTKWGYEVKRIQPVDMFPYTSHVETVCLLVLRNPVTHINIDVDVEELVQDKRGQATYEQIREYVKEQTGLHVTNLNIAQIKRKCGIIERENYNLPKSEDSKQTNCTKEKEEAIKDAFRHFGIIS